MPLNPRQRPVDGAPGKPSPITLALCAILSGGSIGFAATAPQSVAGWTESAALVGPKADRLPVRYHYRRTAPAGFGPPPGTTFALMLELTDGETFALDYNLTAEDCGLAFGEARIFGVAGRYYCAPERSI